MNLSGIVFKFEEAENRCRRAKKIVLLAREKASSVVAGAAPSKLKGLGLEYEDFRNYRYGDDIRFIDWKLSARMIKPDGEMRLITKEFRSEKRVHVVVVFDYSKSMGFKDKYLAALYVLTVISEAARKLEDEVSLLLVSHEIKVFTRLDSWKVPYIVANYICRNSPRGSLSLNNVSDILSRIGRRKPVVFLTDYANSTSDYRKFIDFTYVFYSSLAFFIFYTLGEIRAFEENIALVDPEAETVFQGDSRKFSTSVRTHILSVKTILKNRALFLEFSSLNEAVEKTPLIVLNYCLVREKSLK